MRIARFDDHLVGVVLDDGIHDVTSVLSELPPYRYPLPPYDVFIANLAKLIGKFEQAARRAPALEIEKVKLLSPVANPGKIMAAPVNYTKHLEEVLADKGIHHGNLISEIHKAGIFLKASSSVVGAGEGVRLTHLERRNDHEVELAVVIGKRGRNIAAADALGFVAGYCIGLDMTIRGPEERSLRKSPDSYTVLGALARDRGRDCRSGIFEPEHFREWFRAAKGHYRGSHPRGGGADRLGLVVLYVASRRRPRRWNASERCGCR